MYEDKQEPESLRISRHLSGVTGVNSKRLEVRGEKPSEIATAYDQLDSATMRLDTVAKRLQERLTIVSRSVPQSGIAGDEAVRGFDAPLARNIGEQAERVAGIVNFLEYIISNLEI